MHEMLHVYIDSHWLVLPHAQRKGKHRPAHGVAFQETLIASAARAWDVHVTRAQAKAARKVQRKQIVAYALDDLIMHRLQQKLEIGAICRDTGLSFGYGNP